MTPISFSRQGAICRFAMNQILHPQTSTLVRIRVRVRNYERLAAPEQVLPVIEVPSLRQSPPSSSRGKRQPQTCLTKRSCHASAFFNIPICLNNQTCFCLPCRLQAGHPRPSLHHKDMPALHHISKPTLTSVLKTHTRLCHCPLLPLFPAYAVLQTSFKLALKHQCGSQPSCLPY
jgi:hypothetical protein